MTKLNPASIIYWDVYPVLLQRYPPTTLSGTVYWNSLLRMFYGFKKECDLVWETAKKISNIGSVVNNFFICIKFFNLIFILIGNYKKWLSNIK